MAGAVAPSSQHMTLSHYVPPVSAGSAAGAAASAVDCYTCRRRRVKCDRALPHCAKCERTKLDCLGYKKPLVWNKGVASRGKMMGKTFPAPAAPGPAPAVPTVRTLSSPAAHGHQNAHRPLGVSQQSQLVRPSQLAPQPPSPPAVQVRLPRPVASGNPFEHLDAESRSYMAYFEQRAAADFVLFDRTHFNPYRSLLTVATQHPALLNAMLAVAARHHSNATGAPETKALPYKGRAFGYLSQELKRYGPTATLTRGLTEPTLAVVMLFLFFEALDSGMDTWKIHLRGARRLIQMCAVNSGGAGDGAMLKIFRNHVTLIDIIGRTLDLHPEGDGAADPHDSSPADEWDWDSGELLEALTEGESYNFLGCPAELLQIIHAITLLKTRQYHQQQRELHHHHHTQEGVDPDYDGDASPTSSTSPSSSSVASASDASTATATPDIYSFPALFPAVTHPLHPQPYPPPVAPHSVAAASPAARALLQRISAFSPRAWVYARRSRYAADVTSDGGDLWTHHVEAYREAACIYCLETLFAFPPFSSSISPSSTSNNMHTSTPFSSHSSSSSSSVPSSASPSYSYSSESSESSSSSSSHSPATAAAASHYAALLTHHHALLRQHLSFLPRRSTLLKGAVWPVFVAGTGARDIASRQWVRDMLAALWEVLPQSNIRNAGAVLEGLWARQDAEGENGGCVCGSACAGGCAGGCAGVGPGVGVRGAGMCRSASAGVGAAGDAYSWRGRWGWREGLREGGVDWLFI